jgi:two-component system OmpR family sensor kinase
MRSIRRELLFALLGAMLIALLLGAWATYRAEFQQADVLLDYHLRQLALALRDRPFNAAGGASLQPNDSEFDYSIQVWNEDGVTVYYSYPPHVFPNRAQLGYTTVQTHDGPWRVFAMQSGGEVIQVAQPMSRREQLAAHAAWQSLRAYLLLFPLMGVLVWVLVGNGLAPIARLARAIGARSPAAMAPVSEEVPIEVQPLVRALNDLLSRLQSALQAQRQFVADAAHELRTPLAALQLQAQLVERASGEPARTAALAELRQGLQRSARVVQQLLTLAREEPGAVAVSFAELRLDSLLGTVVEDYRGLAAAKDIALTLLITAGDGVLVGDAVSLRTLLANLLDNALRYTPAGGVVRVSLQRQGQSLQVSIEDSGPGIPPQDRQRVFDRFFRREGVEEPGSGLGLAIVKAIADRHALQLSLGTAELGGLAVRIEFPPATAAVPTAAAAAAAV